MPEQYLGEICVVPFNFPPKGWAFCNGQLLPINQNQALFSLLGTRYGGNGQTTFALPDLRGRMPLHDGAGFLPGQAGGEQAHTLTQAEMPQHMHVLEANTALTTSMTPPMPCPARRAAWDATCSAPPPISPACIRPA